MSVLSWHRLADDLTEQVRELQAKLAALTAENEELRRDRSKYEWCANELMRHGSYYQKKRAGYADFWSLIWQDVLDAYARAEQGREG